MSSKTYGAAPPLPPSLAMGSSRRANRLRTSGVDAACGSSRESSVASGAPGKTLMSFAIETRVAAGGHGMDRSALPPPPPPPARVACIASSASNASTALASSDAAVGASSASTALRAAAGGAGTTRAWKRERSGGSIGVPGKRGTGSPSATTMKSGETRSSRLLASSASLIPSRRSASTRSGCIRKPPSSSAISRFSSRLLMMGSRLRSAFSRPSRTSKRPRSAASTTG